VRVGLGEALDLFAKWKSNRTLLRCDLEFAAFAACFRGRIDDVSGDRVRFASDDSKTELVLPLSTDLEFALVELAIESRMRVSSSSADWFCSCRTARTRFPF